MQKRSNILLKCCNIMPKRSNILSKSCNTIPKRSNILMKRVLSKNLCKRFFLLIETVQKTV